MTYHVGIDLGTTHTSIVFLQMNSAFTMDTHCCPLGERIHYRGTYAVETSGDFVTVLIKLATGMQRRHHRLEGRNFGLGVNAGGDTAAVIGYAHHLAWKEGDLDFVGLPCHCLVARVIKDFLNEMVQTLWPGGANVHTWTLPDRLEPLKDRDIGSIVEMPTPLFCLSFSCHNWYLL